jgi:hypothetical protein
MELSSLVDNYIDISIGGDGQRTALGGRTRVQGQTLKDYSCCWSTAGSEGNVCIGRDAGGLQAMISLLWLVSPVAMVRLTMDICGLTVMHRLTMNISGPVMAIMGWLLMFIRRVGSDGCNDSESSKNKGDLHFPARTVPQLAYSVGLES